MSFRDDEMAVAARKFLTATGKFLLAAEPLARMGGCATLSIRYRGSSLAGKFLLAAEPLARMGGCATLSIRYRGSSLAGKFCSLRNPWRGWVAAPLYPSAIGVPRSRVSFARCGTPGADGWPAPPASSAIGVPRSRVSFARCGTPGADGWLRHLLHPLSGFLARG